ncbi:hypothetical protein LCGC14_2344210 [marine sediment metagenome]|uniref:Uncharacterized protein n=1 Tax=marine sediment metagenome TaxID=412755 RepID=A0A0F9CYN5_9ZZZZ
MNKLDLPAILKRPRRRRMARGGSGMATTLSGLGKVTTRNASPQSHTLSTTRRATKFPVTVMKSLGRVA